MNVKLHWEFVDWDPDEWLEDCPADQIPEELDDDRIKTSTLLL